MSVAGRVKQLGSESVVYGISGTISRSIGIFLVPLYTRVFSPSDYGTIALITTSITLLSTFIVLGMDNASGRWFYDTDDMARRKKVISSWFWVQFIVGLAAALLVFSFAPHIAGLLLKSEQYATLVRLAAILITLGTFGKVVGNWLRYQRRAWMTTVYFTASSLGTIGMIALFVLVWRQGLVGLFSAQVLTGVLAALAAIVILKSWIDPRRISYALAREMLKYGLPLAPAGIASWVTASSDRFILQMFRETSEVGIYAVAASLAGGVALVIGAFQLAWGPFAYSILHERNATQVYAKVLSLYALLGCLLCTAVSLFAPLLLRVLTTPKFYSAASSIPCLAFSRLAMGASFIAALGSGVAKKSMPVAASIFVGAGVNTALNFALIPSLGKDGAALATLIAYMVAAVFLFSASQKHYLIPYRFKEALTCFGFAWLLIGIDHFFLPAEGLGAFVARVGMCLLFIPLAFWLGIARPEHVGRLLARVKQRSAADGEYQRGRESRR